MQHRDTKPSGRDQEPVRRRRCLNFARERPDRRRADPGGIDQQQVSLRPHSATRRRSIVSPSRLQASGRPRSASRKRPRVFVWPDPIAAVASTRGSSRHQPEVPEDPATGSGSGALGAYLGARARGPAPRLPIVSGQGTRSAAKPVHIDLALRDGRIGDIRVGGSVPSPRCLGGPACPQSLGPSASWSTIRSP